MATCKQCHKAVDDNLDYCPHCDTRLDEMADAAAVGHSAVGESAAKTSGKGKTAAITAIVVAALAICAAALWFFIIQPGQKEDPLPVELTIVAEGYSPESSSPIPVHVEGTDFAGNEVSQDCLVGGKEGLSLSLNRGIYTATVTSTPITDDGTMYNVENASIEIDLMNPTETSDPEEQASKDSGNADDPANDEQASAPEESEVQDPESANEPADADQASSSEDQAGQNPEDSNEADGNEQSSASEENQDQSSSSAYEMVLTPLDPLTITEDDIQAACDALIAAGMDEEEVEQYRSAVIAKVEEAQAAERERIAELERAAERQRVKEGFESDLAQLRDEYRYLANTFETQQEINVGSSEYYQKFDSLMGEVYAYLLEELPDEDIDALVAAQENWLNTREAEMYAAESEGFGGTIAPALRNDKGIEVTQMRVTELINMIP